MRQSRSCRRLLRFCLLLTLFVISASHVRPKQYPIKIYTQADGLAHDRVKKIVRDSRGFIWLCTADGISRFDGYRFVTFDSRHGLLYPSANDLLETRAGSYWIATNGSGVARLDPPSATTAQNPGRITPVSADDQNRKLFKIYQVGDQASTNRVNVLFEDHERRIWAGTDGGLFQMTPGSGVERFGRVDLSLADSTEFTGHVWAIKEDQDHQLWFATTRGIWHSGSDGRVVQYRTPALINLNIVTMSIDREGRIWAGHGGGLLIFKPDSMIGGVKTQDPLWQEINRSRQDLKNGPAQLPENRGEAVRYTTADGLSNNSVTSIYLAGDGRTWIGTASGLTEFSDGRLRSYADTPMVKDQMVIALAEDREGNLWLGTYGGGAMKLARNGFTAFGKSDGLEEDVTQIDHIFQTPDGELGVITRRGRLYEFDGTRFVGIHPQFAGAPRAINDILRDRAGDYWISTAGGLHRFTSVRSLRDLERTPSKEVDAADAGLSGKDIWLTFEDSRGDIWIGANGPDPICRWERSTGTLHRYHESDGLPRRDTTVDIAEDHAGTVWFSFRGAGLVRYQRGGFDKFTIQDASGREARRLFLDRAGRLWLAMSNVGLIQIDQPEAGQPKITTYTMAQGLLSNVTLSITEDHFGRIYIGNSRGVDRLDPATGRIKHYSTADGLAGNETFSAYTDAQGALWFGSPLGLSRLTPTAEQADRPPVFISGLQVAGVAYQLSPLGETRIEGLVFEPGQRQLQLDFFALGFASGEALRYQYFIDGLSPDWSVPSDQRTLALNLTPGSYRISVRAISSDGALSSVPAMISFTILRPIWQRWWFVALALCTLGAVAYVVYRYRMAQLLKVERVRIRIATDLHDDIGASLSRMAILSEVVKQQTASGDGQQAAGFLSDIAESARGLVDSMSDIVWSIDPRRDDVQSVVRRIRQFASDVLEAREIDWELRVPPEVEALKLGPDERQHLYLIFKEAINNVVRHGEGAKSVSMSMRIEGRQLVGEVKDDGCGFMLQAPEAERSKGRGGNGLPNLRARAAQLRGQLEVASVPDAGTTLTLRMPIK